MRNCKPQGENFPGEHAHCDPEPPQHIQKIEDEDENEDEDEAHGQEEPWSALVSVGGSLFQWAFVER